MTNNVSEATAPESAIKQLTLWRAGERDIEVHKIMHQILELKLYRCSSQMITVSLDNSKRCTLSSLGIEVEKSQLKIYGGRFVLGQALKNLNLVEFFKTYKVIFFEGSLKKKLIVIRTTTIYS